MTLLGGGAMFPDHVRDKSRCDVAAHDASRRDAPPDTFVLARRRLLRDRDRGLRSRAAIVAAGDADRHERVRRTGDGRATVLADVTEAHKLQRRRHPRHAPDGSGWGRSFRSIAGLVMERGGMLSHGAIIAREFGIPSIVGVADATRLHSPAGATVCLDGDRGNGARRLEPAGGSDPERCSTIAYARERLRRRGSAGLRRRSWSLVAQARSPADGSARCPWRWTRCSRSLLVIAFRILG